MSETNTANFIFFSNCLDFAHFDQNDRRYCAIWTPEPRAASIHRAARIDIAPDGGCSLRRIEAAAGVEVEQLRAQHYQPAPTPATARDQALAAAAAWLAGIDAVAGEQSQSRRKQCAITRLRLIEMRAADWLPTDEMRELTAAIDGVVNALRAATEHPRGVMP